MFDLKVTTDKGAYTDGEPVVVTVAASDDRPITVDDVYWSLHSMIPDPDSPGETVPHGPPVRFTVDGATATGAALSGHGSLYVHAVDSEGRDAATYVGIRVTGDRNRPGVMVNR